MKVVQENSDLTRSQVVNRTACGIQLNAHSFQILSRLYSDPILAILRELGTNASESHARAGCSDTQFVVKLPNKLDPTFSVRDFGTGMSVDTVHNVYRNYMASDKRDTNKEGGYFGLGSKTPFCYTDSFNVICYENGTCRRYVMALNEEGCPELNEFPPCETDKPDGVEVSFAVQEKDFDKFKSKAEEAYRFFRFRPRIVGASNVQIKDLDYLVRDPDSKSNGIVTGYQSYVIMGDIGYPLDEHQFSDNIRQLIRSGAVVEVGMGGLNLVPSREGLEYTDHTKATITKKCEELLAKLNMLVDKEFDSCKSFWGASLLYQKLNTKFGVLSKYIKCLNEKSFHEQVLRERMTLSFKVKKLQVKYRYGHGYYVKRPVETNIIVIKEETQLFVADDTGPYSRIRNRILSGSADSEANYYIIEEDDLPEFLAKSGLTEDDLTRVSTLPKVKRQRYGGGSTGTRRPRTYQNVLEFDPQGRQSGNRLPHSEYWSDDQVVDIHDGDFVYCRFYRNEIDDSMLSVCKLSRVLNSLRSLGIDAPKIYGVRKTDKVKKLDNWKTLDQYLAELNEVICAKFNVNDFEKIKDAKELIDILKRVLRSTTLKLNRDNHMITRLIEALEVDHNSVTYLLDFLKKYDKMGGSRERRAGGRISVLIKKIRRKYPFIEHIHKYGICRQTADDIITTINALDTVSST